MDRLAIEERPLAVGYFLLDTMRTLFLTGVSPNDAIDISFALVTEDDIEEFKKHGVDVFEAPKPIAALSDLYKLMVQVSRGDEE